MLGQQAEKDSGAACRICLVASCPGGVASNVVTYLARADVPLSVAMTTVSTLTAIVATPALAKLLVGKLVPVDAGSLLLSTLQACLQTLLLSPLVSVPYISLMCWHAFILSVLALCRMPSPYQDAGTQCDGLLRVPC